MGGDPRVTGLAGVAVLAVLLGGYMYWSVGTRQDELQAQIDRDVADSTNLATTIRLVHELEARQDTIREKIGIIKSVDQRRYVWPHILDEVSHSLPPYTWLTKIASEEPPAPPPAAAPRPAPGDTGKKAAPAAPAPPPAPVGPLISIEGNTASTQALTRFMKNLEASPMIRDVALVTSSQATEAGRVVLRFSLEAKYEVPDASAIQTVPLFVAR
jgi:Tfp pilus assembly protein PilN